MECQKCGYIMDAFTAECPRCARMKADGASTATLAPPNPLAGGAAVSQIPHAPSSGFVFSLKQIVTIVGSLGIFIGVFTPAISVPFLGGVSLMQFSSMINSAAKMGGSSTFGGEQSGAIIFFLRFACYLFMLFAAGALVSAFTKWRSVISVAGLSSLTVTTFLIVCYFVKMIEANNEIKKVSAALAEKISVFSTMPLGWGALLLLIGSIALTTAAFLRDPEMD